MKKKIKAKKKSKALTDKQILKFAAAVAAANDCGITGKYQVDIGKKRNSPPYYE